MSVITITLNNVSCSDEGVLRVAALLGDELAIAQTIFLLHLLNQMLLSDSRHILW
jgi:hypothetical protein